jgi:hypothetical protein
MQLRKHNYIKKENVRFCKTVLRTAAGGLTKLLAHKLLGWKKFGMELYGAYIGIAGVLCKGGGQI